MKKIVESLFEKFSFFTAAEATIISFVLMSLIGGGILYGTEKNRDVHAKQAVLQEVNVTPTTPLFSGTVGEAPTQTHTFVQNIQYKGEKFIDTWFTAVSALCVTGLTSTDFSEFTLGGQIITMILIQMGGLGIIVFTSLFAFAVVQGLSEGSSFKNLLANILDAEGHEVGTMLKHVFMYTFLIEGLATVIMGVHLQFFVDPAMINNLNPWWWSLFHSVSAFNNAGFGLMNNNLVNFVNDSVISLTIAFLIILGGIGYPVLIAGHAAMSRVIRKRESAKQQALEKSVNGVMASPVQLRVAIWGTFALLSIGTIIPLIVEWNNPIMEGHTVWQKVLIAFFQSTSTRTAGFNTIDIGALGAATLFLYMLLMYIGANPAGTGGGIKIPTFAVLVGYILDWFKKPNEPVRLFGGVISKFAVSHAIRLFFFSLSFIGVVTFLITLVEYKFLMTPDPTFNFLKVIFEIFSAFGTVGLSMGFAGGVTSFAAILTPFSKFLLIATMLFGRVGPLTLLAALPWKRRFHNHPPSEDHAGAQKVQIG
mgnify:CR=1 FL=1